MKANNSIKKNKVIIVLSLIITVVLSIGGFVIYKIFDKQKPTSTKEIGEIYYHQTEAEHIASEESGIMYADNEILIIAKDDASKSEIEELAKDYDAEIVGFIEQTNDYQWLFDDVYTYAELDELVSKLESESCIESANINFVTEISLTGYDEYVNHGSAWSNETWDSGNPNGLNWGLEAIDAMGAWEYADRMTPVKVGLIDSGFDAPASVEQTLIEEEKNEDSDFANSLYDQTMSTAKSKGHEDLNFAATFYNHPLGNVAHGTHVAGTMAAISDNDIGICGVYPFGNGNLYGASWRLAGKYNTCMSEKCTFAELILRDVKVINCSYGKSNAWIEIEGYDNKVYKEWMNIYADILGEYFQKFIDLGYDFVIVQSAGNESNKIYARLKTDANGEIEYTWSGHVTCAEDGTLARLVRYTNSSDLYYLDSNKVRHKVDNSSLAVRLGYIDSKYNSFITAISPEKYPDVYNRIIVVGSVGINNDGTYHLSNFTGYGERVDILAPGESIYSTTPGNNYENHNWQGTSMAAPHVSGVAAMVWSADNSLTGAEVKEIICEYSSQTPVDKNLVNARRAVKAALGYTDKENEEIFVVVLDEEEVEETPVTENGAILNYVVDSAGEPIPEAKIIAKLVDENGELQDMPEEYTATTDVNGHFEIILPAGEYVLVVEVENGEYDSFVSEKYTVLDGEVCYCDDYFELHQSQTDGLEYQFASVVEYGDNLIFISYDEDNYKYNLVEYNCSSNNYHHIEEANPRVFTSNKLLMIDNKLFYNGENGLHMYDLNLRTDDFLLETKGEIAGINPTNKEIVLVSTEYNNTTNLIISKYNYDNKSYTTVKEIHNGYILSYIDGEVFYYTVTKEENWITDTDATINIQSFNIFNQLNSSVSTQIVPSYSTDMPGIRHFYADSDNIIYLCGTSGGSGATFSGKLIHMERNTSTETIILDSTNITEFFVNDNSLFYNDNNTSCVYDLKSGSHQSFNYIAIDCIYENYVLGSDAEGNLVCYNMSVDEINNVIEKNDIIISSDPSDAYCTYGCIGVVSNKAIISIQILSYDEKYNPLGWRPGHVRNQIIILDLATLEHVEPILHNFNISKYTGTFKLADSPTYVHVKISDTTESVTEIEVNIMNSTGTRVSQIIYNGAVADDLLTFESDDGYGRNTYTLEFVDDKIYLSTYNIECYGLWMIPEFDRVELVREAASVEVDWQQIYADKLFDFIQTNNRYDSGFSTFDLFDVDENGIPELVISSGQTGMDSCNVYEIYEGQLRELEVTGEYGTIGCSSNEHLLGYEGYANGGFHYIGVYKYENGEICEVFNADDDEGYAGQGNAQYFINDSAVSKDEYYSEIEFYYNIQWVGVGLQYALDESTINSVLLS